MNYSASRLTLYALISALEEDLRSLLVSLLPTTSNIPEVLGEELFQKSFLRFQGENGEGSYITSLDDLLPFLDFPDAFQLICKHKSNFPDATAKAFVSIVPQLERMIGVRNRVSHTRPINFEDLPLTLDTIERLKKEIVHKWEAIDRTTSLLKDNPGYVLNLVLPLPPKDKVASNLPIPDFDETGFMGRIDQVSSLHKMLQGPYPVISIIGEGGLGKSALALKVAYDILDYDDPLFDCIVWSSAKAATVTASEIKRIENAISDSLGMFRSIEQELSGQTAENPIDEILSYLSEFRILLILDNLETIIDESLLSFFEQLPVGSKVLTTSRIGLGQFERRLTLVPMKNGEASQLLRVLSKTRGITQLGDAPQARLNDYCHKLKNNPGFVKWFVSCVQAGRRPEEVLQTTEVFLEFCLSNVFGYLSVDSKRILKAMQAISRPLSIPEFAFLLEMEPVRLQMSIHQLLQTNMLVMSAHGEGVSSETRYSLSELARSYLVRKHPIPGNDYSLYKRREKDLISAQDELRASVNSDSASVFRIVVRHKSDAIIASYLIRALKLQQQNNTEDALDLIDTAKELSPGYYEVHRCEAWVHAQSGNIPGAKRAYEAALELEDKSASLHIWYSGFIQRHEHDYELALQHVEHAERIDAGNYHAQLEKTRLLMHMKKFDLAASALSHLKRHQLNLTVRSRRVMWDLTLQIPSRIIEHLFRSQDYLGTVRATRSLLEVLATVPRDMLDNRISNRLRYNYQQIKGAYRHLVDSEHRAEADGVIEDMETEISFIGIDPHDEWNPKDFGTVVRLQPRFGFVRINGTDKELYFAISNVKYDSEEENVENGDEMEFSIGHNSQGECAVDCRILRKSSESESS